LRILILVDGNHKIGMGHVFRALNIAKFLKKRKHKIIFLTKESSAKKIISKTNECKLSQKFDDRKIIKFLHEFKPDITILDKLNETRKNLMILHKIQTQIVAIDYTGKHKDMIHYGINYLYQKSGMKKNSYSGFKYTVLDDNFLKNLRKMFQKNIQTVLVLQGGADTYCFTPKIIKALDEIDLDFKISVVLGPSFKCWSKINRVLKNCQKPVKIHHNVKNMTPILKEGDFAVTAAGNSLLELAFLGIPSLINLCRRI